MKCNVARFAHGCNNDMNVNKITNCVLMGLMSHSRVYLPGIVIWTIIHDPAAHRPTTIIFHCPLTLHLFTHASFRNSQLVNAQKISVCGVLSHKWDLYITHCPLRAQRPLRKNGAGRLYEPEVQWGLEQNSVFWIWRMGTLNERTAVWLFAQVLPSQDQTNQHSSNDRRDSHKLPLLAEELLAVDGFWRRESQFS